MQKKKILLKRETLPLMVIVKYKAVILRRVTKGTFSPMVIVKYEVVIRKRTINGMRKRCAKRYLRKKLFLLWSLLSIRLLFLEESQKKPSLL